MEEFINYSGGASGSDKLWEQLGKQFGIGKTVVFRPEDLYKLDPSEQREVENAYLAAARALGRNTLPFNWNYKSPVNYSGGLVRRDFLQAKFADAIYAISDIVNPGEKGKANKTGIRYANRTAKQIVDGGTGYAVQMGIQLQKEVYVFHQKTVLDSKVQQGWYIWDGEKFAKTELPILKQKFAGIGTRELNENGKEAILHVYQKTKLSYNLSKAKLNDKDFAGLLDLDVKKSNEESISRSVEDDFNKTKGIKI